MPVSSSAYFPASGATPASIPRCGAVRSNGGAHSQVTFYFFFPFFFPPRQVTFSLRCGVRAEVPVGRYSGYFCVLPSQVTSCLRSGQLPPTPSSRPPTPPSRPPTPPSLRAPAQQSKARQKFKKARQGSQQRQSKLEHRVSQKQSVGQQSPSW